MYSADAFIDPENLITQLSTAIVGGALSLTQPGPPLNWANPDDAQVMRSAHGKLNTGIAAIPALMRMLTGETADTLVFIAVATGSATPKQLAELLESDELTIDNRIQREVCRHLDSLDQRLADLTPAETEQLQITASGLTVDNLPEAERDDLTSRLDELGAAVRARIASGDTETVDQLLTPRWLNPWRPSILLNLDRQLRQIRIMSERFPSTYGRSLADLLASLLRQADSRVVDREQVRQLWRARYPQAAAESVRRTSRRPATANDTVGTKAKASLSQACRALERAGVISRRDDDTIQVVDVRRLVEIALQYTGADAAFSGVETPATTKLGN